MKTAVVKNTHYTIQVDREKNRLYLTLVGYWKSPDEVPNYIGDLTTATQQLSTDYTILTDVTQMKTPAPSIVALHTEAQKIVVNAGLKKTAELVGSDAIVKMSLKRFSQESGMPKGTFDDQQEAEDWLDKAV